MIVDGKGNLFENRRKANSDRRKNTVDTTGGRRKGERRKDTSSEGKNRKR